MVTTTLTSSAVTTGTISSTGVGSGLEVSSIVAQLMDVEKQPLLRLQKKEASYNATLSAFGSLSSALSTFQTAVSGLSDISKFQGLSATSSDAGVLSATANTKSVMGSYNINVSQIAQAQSIATAGQSSVTASVGSGATTTLSFQFGTISGGTFGSASLNGSKLSASVASSGIAANSLSINGTTIATSAATTSASALASAINLQTGTTGVTATAQATDTGAGSALTTALGTFTTLDSTGAAGTYSLNVGGVSVLNNALAVGGVGTGPGGAIQLADIDTALAAASADLTSAGITMTGTLAGNDLRFTKSDGSNVAITQTNGGDTTGGFAALSSSALTYTSSVSLSSANAITIAGTNSATAGLAAGTIPNGTYTGASFIQDANQATGTVTISSSNNSLQGMRDAINAANIGVTATIVSDSSSNPYHLVITSNKTGETSSMKIGVSGDASIAAMLGYDPTNASGQAMTQTSAGQNAKLTVNGIAVSSATNTVSDAIQGVTLNVAKAGTTSLAVARDSNAVQTNVTAFVNAFNTISKALTTATAYNASTKISGPLQGDSTAHVIQNGLRNLLGTSVTGLTGDLKSLSQIGVSLQKDGTLAVNSTKLQVAINNNFNDIAGLFATAGTTTDSLINYSGASLETKPGNAAINITQMATKGKLTGSNAAALTITANVNDSLSVTVDGKVANVKLEAGTYTATSLAAHVQSVVNGSSAMKTANIGVVVAADSGGVITMTSNQYGSFSKVTASDAASITLFGATPTTTTGKDVAGTVGGVEASGSGQFLTAGAGSGVKGLKLQITGGSTGDRGTVNYSQGYAFQFTKLVDNYVGTNGIIPSRITGLNTTIKNLQSQESGWQARLTTIQARYQRQFSALDVALGSMKTTSNFLSQQLDLISAQTKGIANG